MNALASTLSVPIVVTTELQNHCPLNTHKTSINEDEGITNILINIAEEFEDGMDFQLQYIELPSCNPLVHPQYGHSKLKTSRCSP